MNHHNVTHKKYLTLLFCLVGMLFLLEILGGCQKDSTQIIDDGSSGNNDLMNPAIQPKVLSTYPENNSVGPFNLNNATDYFKPHFVIQMNKLINLSTIYGNTVRISGFNRPVVAAVYREYYPWYGKTSSPYDDILAFIVNDSLFYNIMLYTIGTTYTVTIDSSLEDINGNHLRQQYQFSFTPEPYFRITSIFPSNGSTDNSMPDRIVLEFNNRVDSTIFSSIHISPEVVGQWGKPGESITFIPANSFSYNTTYTITFEGDAHDVQGHQIDKSYSSSFTTPAFRVLSFSPDRPTVSPFVSPIAVYFSGPIDTGSAPAAFSIVPAIPGNIKYFPNQFAFYPSPDELLPNTRYDITVGINLKSSDGTHLTEPFHFSFTTEPFMMIFSSPSNGATGVALGSGISVWFNARYDTGTVRSNFSIVPNVSGSFEMDTNSSNFWFTPTAALNVNAIYTVTLGSGIRSKSGAMVDAPYTFSFTTGQ